MQATLQGRVRAGLVALLLIGTSALALRQFRDLERYSDEVHHLRQISAFCAGDLRLDRKLTTLPGFHALAAAIGRATGDCSLAAVRRLNALLGLLSAAAFWWAARAAGAPRPALRTLHYWLLPVLLPYHFLAYTDTLSLLLVLLAVGLALRDQPGAAGAVGALSILARQTNVVWLPLLAALGPGPVRSWRRLLAIVPGLLAFAVFVALNRGIAMGDQRAHHAGLFTGNLFFGLSLLCGLFLPRVLALLWRERARLADPRLLALLAALAALYAVSFGLEHAYNRFPGFLRNELLMRLEQSPLLTAGFFLLIALATAALWVDRLSRPAFHLLYPVALLALLPVKLVDQRYAFVPLVLLLLFRREDADWVEGLGLAQSAGLAAFFVLGISRGLFLL
jgi:alpha-1,2-glucosyltransferase